MRPLPLKEKESKRPIPALSEAEEKSAPGLTLLLLLSSPNYLLNSHVFFAATVKKLLC